MKLAPRLATASSNTSKCSITESVGTRHWAICHRLSSPKPLNPNPSARKTWASPSRAVLAQVTLQVLRKDGVLREWLQPSAVGPLNIKPGRPWENGYPESFHSKLRDEFLSSAVFESLRDAVSLGASWRRQYNEVRPHGSLGYVTPAEFARAWDMNSSSRVRHLAYTDSYPSAQRCVSHSLYRKQDSFSTRPSAPSSTLSCLRRSPV